MADAQTRGPGVLRVGVLHDSITFGFPMFIHDVVPWYMAALHQGLLVRKQSRHTPKRMSVFWRPNPKYALCQGTTSWMNTYDEYLRASFKKCDLAAVGPKSTHN